MWVFVSVVQAEYVVNGDFSAGSTGWTTVQSGDGVVTYPNLLDVVGSYDGVTDYSFNGASQVITVFDDGPITLTFDLVRYTSDDYEWYDIPYVMIDGNVYVLNIDGTVDWLTSFEEDNMGVWYFVGGDAVQDVNNDTAILTPITYAVDLGMGPATFTIEIGVFSADSWFGPGYAQFDNISVVPEPATVVLLGLGVAGIGLIRSRKN